MTDNHFSPYDLYVSTQGNDRWTGRLAEPNAAGTDGPFATLARARNAVRALKEAGQLPGPLTVWLRGGRYPIHQPVVFGPQDSAPVMYAAYPGETPVIDGGVPIAAAAWHTEQVNGKTAWVAQVPYTFRELFVNGQRRPRARLPKVGPEPERRQFFWMQEAPDITLEANLFDGSDRFIARPDDFKNWKNLQDVEVVVLHYWIEERMPVASYDPATRMVQSSRCSMFALKDDFNKRWAKYYIDNVFEALTEPGEWYLDKGAGKLYYLPVPGETPGTAEVYAPRADQFVKLVGDPDQNRYVEFLRFEGLTFEHGDWHELDVLPEPDTGMPTNRKYAATPQAAAHVPGAIYMEGARFCAVEDCTIQHVGFYAVELADGCLGNRIVGNEMFDLGAGGVKLNGADVHGPAARQTGNNVITDNHIHTGGRVYHSGIGVAARHSFGNEISHNHIHDFFYSAISCGWVWGYRDSISHNNHIEKNHIHDLGHAWLSDMGGVYTLSVQPGTTIRGNVIHDVERANYGGWAIYPDEGSSHIVIEDNICYNTNSQTFHQHYGHENVVRNNIFVFGAEGNLGISRVDGVNALTLERNIFVTDGQPALVGGYGNDYGTRCLISDLNLFWDVSGKPATFQRGGYGRPGAQKVALAEWQQGGNDTHSLDADPCFKDLKQCDFTLDAASPALKLGFRPIDTSDVGPRPKGKRG
ncbi:MAG: right-handed parallel beta-helix repeat-containing protein [Chloroflexi bacterium]|nr:right-handed parallel beta-helix repeat-containing protein [Chloroflexota bacterium]